MAKYTEGPYLRLRLNDNGDWPRSTSDGWYHSPDIIPWGTVSPELGAEATFGSEDSYKQDPTSMGSSPLILNASNQFYVRAANYSSQSYKKAAAIVFAVPSNLFTNPQTWFSQKYALKTTNQSWNINTTDGYNNPESIPYSQIFIPAGSENKPGIGVTTNPLLWVPDTTIHHCAAAVILTPDSFEEGLDEAYNKLVSYSPSLEGIGKWLATLGNVAWRNLTFSTSITDGKTFGSQLNLNNVHGGRMTISLQMDTKTYSELLGMDVEWVATDDSGKNVTYAMLGDDHVGPLRMTKQRIQSSYMMSVVVDVPSDYKCTKAYVNFYTNGKAWPGQKQNSAKTGMAPYFNWRVEGNSDPSNHPNGMNLVDLGFFEDRQFYHPTHEGLIPGHEVFSLGGGSGETERLTALPLGNVLGVFGS